jgi:hypothetical protein
MHTQNTGSGPPGQAENVRHRQQWSEWWTLTKDRPDWEIARIRQEANVDEDTAWLTLRYRWDRKSLTDEEKRIADDVETKLYAHRMDRDDAARQTRAAAQAAADERAELVRAITERSRAFAESPRHRISAVDRAEIAERKIAREQREQKEAAEVRAWISRRNIEDTRQGEPVATKGAAESGD